MRKTDWEWKKKCVKLKPEEFAAFDRAAKDGGYRNGHHALRSFALTLLSENPPKPD